MFKKVISGIIFSVLFTGSICSKDRDPTPSRKVFPSSKGLSAAHGVYSTTSISMMEWGTGMAVAIAMFSAIIKTGQNEDFGMIVHAH